MLKCFPFFSIVLNLLFVHPNLPTSTNPIRNIRPSQGVRKKKLFPYFTNEQMESPASGRSGSMANDANDFLISCADTVAAFPECDGHSPFHKIKSLESVQSCPSVTPKHVSYRQGKPRKWSRKQRLLWRELESIVTSNICSDLLWVPDILNPTAQYELQQSVI